MAAGGIFIAYRREDSQGEAGRIDDRLRPLYGAQRVFRDVSDPPIGVGHADHLVRQVATCAAVIVVIGRHWLAALVARRDRQDDWLRAEVSTALRSPGVTVIPVLVQGAAMPAAEQLPDDIRALATLQVCELSDSRWDYDMRRLLELLDNSVGLDRRVVADAVKVPRFLVIGLVVVGAAVSIAAVALAVVQARLSTASLATLLVLVPFAISIIAGLAGAVIARWRAYVMRRDTVRSNK